MGLFSKLLESAQTLHEFDVLDPNGEAITIRMRVLTPTEQLDIETAVPLPKPPVADIQRFEGVVQQIYATGDPAYLQALQNAHRRRTYMQIIQCWEETVPGDTVDEQIDNLGRLPSWTLAALVRVIREINALREDHVLPRPFRGNGSATE